MPDVKSDIGLIASMVKEGLSLWKTFLATRQEAYNRQMDIKKSKAIENGEKYILTNKNLNLDPKKKQKLLDVYEKRFFAYNN